MSKDWFYAQGDEQHGPIDERELQRLAATGELHTDDLVWRKGMPEWVAASTVPDLFDGADAPPPRSGGGSTNPYAAPDDSAPKRPKRKRRMEYATFGARFVAAFVDGVIGMILGALIGGVAGGVLGGIMGANGAGVEQIQNVAGPLGNILGIFVAWLYEALMVSSPAQATYGKQMMGLYVTDLEGRRIGFTRATGRHFAKNLSVLTLFIGYIMAAFTERRQALHDICAGTLVLKH
ncbi:MAG: RDD family protein [Planctomycetia bacterium]